MLRTLKVSRNSFNRPKFKAFLYLQWRKPRGVSECIIYMLKYQETSEVALKTKVFEARRPSLRSRTLAYVKLFVA